MRLLTTPPTPMKLSYAQKQFLLAAADPAGKMAGNTNRTADVLERAGMIEPMECRHAGYSIVWRTTAKGHAAINDPGGKTVPIQEVH